METVEVGWNRLVGTNPEHILATVRELNLPAEHPPLFGDGRAAERIADILNAAPITFGQNYDRVVANLAAQPVAA